MDRSIPDRHSAARFALYTLIFNLVIILWGALVRATGSGAGCGAHWPLCNGEVVPGIETVHRAIEFTHRASVGVGIIVVTWMWVVVRRAVPPYHPARSAANFTVLFTVSESLIGAGLVLFKLVEHDASVYRAVAVSAHLVNTFLLVASLSLTVWWCGHRAPLRIGGQGALSWLVGGALAGALLVGVTGAVTALGDTLFPAGTVADIGKPAPASAPFFLGLRVYHPMAAVAVGVFAVVVARIAAHQRPGTMTRAMAYYVSLAVAAQIAVGFCNLYLLAPLAMQLVHLLLADALWIALILLAASALAEGAPRARRVEAQRLTAESTQ